MIDKQNQTTSAVADPDQDFVRAFARAGELLEVGMASVDIANVLTKEKHPTVAVTRVVQNLAPAVPSGADTSDQSGADGKKLIYPALWCAGGILVAAINFLVSGPGFLLFLGWLVAAYGVVKFIKNLREFII